MRLLNRLPTQKRLLFQLSFFTLFFHSVFILFSLSFHSRFTLSLSLSLSLSSLGCPATRGAQAVLEFRLGWNFESFHTLLAESLAHELRVSWAALDRDKGGAGRGDLDEGAWKAEVRLRLLGLHRLGEILEAVQRSPAGTEVRLLWSRHRVVRLFPSPPVSRDAGTEACQSLLAALRNGRGRKADDQPRHACIYVYRHAQAGLAWPPGMKRRQQLIQALEACLVED